MCVFGSRCRGGCTNHSTAVATRYQIAQALATLASSSSNQSNQGSYAFVYLAVRSFGLIGTVRDRGVVPFLPERAEEHEEEDEYSSPELVDE